MCSGFLLDSMNDNEDEVEILADNEEGVQIMELSDEDEVEVLAIRDKDKVVGASLDCVKDLEVLRIVNQEEICLVAQFLIGTKSSIVLSCQ